MNDDPSWLYVQVERLKWLGYEVLQAENGWDGLQLARMELPDIVISDIHMDVINGFELCKCIRAIDITANIPVVLFSETLISSEGRRLGTAAGATAMLPTKPDLSDLITAISQLTQ